VYDLSWARQRVEDFLVLCTRAQLVGRDFIAWQERFEVKNPIPLVDCLVFALAVSQGDADAHTLWENAKRLIKKPMNGGKPVENVYRDLYLIGYRKGRRWHQEGLPLTFLPAGQSDLSYL